MKKKPCQILAGLLFYLKIRFLAIFRRPGGLKSQTQYKAPKKFFNRLKPI